MHTTTIHVEVPGAAACTSSTRERTADRPAPRRGRRPAVVGRARAASRRGRSSRRPLRRARVRPVDDRGRRVLAPGRPACGDGRARDRPGGARRQFARRDARVRHGDRVARACRGRRRRRGRARRVRQRVDARGRSRSRKEYERVDKAEPFDADALTAFEVKVWVDGPLQPPAGSPPRSATWSTRWTCRSTRRATSRAGDPPRPIRRRPPGELRCPVLAIAGRLDSQTASTTARHIEADAPERERRLAGRRAHDRDGAPERLAKTVVDFLAPLQRWG